MSESARIEGLWDPKQLYAGQAGRALAVDVLSFVRSVWGSHADSRLHFACIGYPVPDLETYVRSANSFVLLTPSFVGPIPWSVGLANQSAVVDETHLPVRDACFHRVLVFHTFDQTADLDSCLEELWRVTCPGGRVIAMILKHQKKISPSHFKKCLLAKGFVPLRQSGALFGGAGHQGQKHKLSTVLKTLNSWGGHVGAAYFLVEAEKRQGGHVVVPKRAAQSPRMRAMPS